MTDQPLAINTNGLEAIAAQNLITLNDGNYAAIELELDFANDNAMIEGLNGEKWSPPGRTPEQRIATKAQHALARALRNLDVDPATTEIVESVRRAAMNRAIEELGEIAAGRLLKRGAPSGPMPYRSNF